MTLQERESAAMGPVPVTLLPRVEEGPPCGLPERQDYYGDGALIYWQRCMEPIWWRNQEDNIIWCTAGHERTLA